MNPILLSFLCGAAFIGGAAATTVMVVLVVQMRDKRGRHEIVEYWHKSIAQHETQLKLLERLVTTIEKR